MKKAKRTPSFAITLFGILGYFSVMLQWLWLAVLTLPAILENQTVKNLFLPHAQVNEAPTMTFQTPPVMLAILAVIITIIVLVVTVIILVRLPASIAKVGKRTTDTVAHRVVIPAVSHHKKLPAKKERTLTIRMVKYLKFTALILPMALLSVGQLMPLSLAFDIALFVGGVLAINSLVWFCLEYTVATLTNTDIATIY